jgi:DNA-directed RNA polymerase subunit L
MAPQIHNISEDNGYLKFTLQNINVSLANAIRRIIISEIPTYVFRTSPYAENKCTIDINTTRLNNELLKQRLSCIPIHIKENDFPYKDYVVEADVQNNTDTIIYVTTKDFRIKNTKTDTYLSDTDVRKIFPPDDLTGDFIDFARLRPKLSDKIGGEQLKFSCKLDIGTSKQDSMFNIVSTCAYANTPDDKKIALRWNKIEKDMRKQKHSKEDIEYHKKDWMILESQRIYTPNSFDFVIESIGIYDNLSIVKMACKKMVEKLETFRNILQSEGDVISQSEDTMDHSYDIMLNNEDYTLGKVIEYFLYSEYFEKQEVLTFCGFRKPHPHINNSFIRIALKKEPEGKNTIITYLNDCIEKAVYDFEMVHKELS